MTDKGQLSLGNLGDVLEELYEANNRWYNIGLRLGLQPSSLDRIKEISFRDPGECFREMLKEWFKHCFQDCSWLTLVRALRSTAVGEHSLARRMEKKYCYDDYTEMKAPPMPLSTSNSYVKSTYTPTNGSSKCRVKKIPFGCGCGNCSLNNFLDGRCSEPKESLSSFPFLKTSELNQPEIVILKGRLYEEFTLITREFSKFNTAICESLIDRDIPVQKITRVLRDLRTFSSAFCDSPSLGTCWPSIIASETVDNIFNILSDYVSFFNFQITDHIVDVLGSASDKLLLSEYQKKVDEYCKRNIFECPSYSTLFHEEATLILKVEGLEQYNMKHLSRLISHVSKALLVTNHTLKLCSVEEGCVKLNFQVPQCIEDKLFPLNADTISRLMNIGKLTGIPVYISLVKCAKWLYKLPHGQAHATQGRTLEKIMHVCSIYSHGLLSRTNAEQILNSVEYDCFLIRESIRYNNSTVYSLKQHGKFVHSIFKTKRERSCVTDQEAGEDLEFFINEGPQTLCVMPFPTEGNDTRQRTSSYIAIMDEMEERAEVTASDIDRDSMGDCMETGSIYCTIKDNMEDCTGTGDRTETASVIGLRCEQSLPEKTLILDHSVKVYVEDCTGTGAIGISCKLPVSPFTADHSDDEDDFTGTGDSAIGMSCKLPVSPFTADHSDYMDDFTGTGDSAIGMSCKLPISTFTSDHSDYADDFTGTGDSAIGFEYKFSSAKQSADGLSVPDSTKGNYQGLEIYNLQGAHTYASIGRGEFKEN